jgi:addiction module HigA family antidote
MRQRRIAPVHPGEVLLEDFLKPMGHQPVSAGQRSAVPAPRIHDLVHGRRAMTADSAIRLARFFGIGRSFG